MFSARMLDFDISQNASRQDFGETLAYKYLPRQIHRTEKFLGFRSASPILEYRLAIIFCLANASRHSKRYTLLLNTIASHEQSTSIENQL